MTHTWLGVDLGNARVGIALSDPDLLLAHPEEYIAVSGDYFYALEDVIAVIEDNNVDHVVVGYPLQLDGTEGKSAKKAKRWAQALTKRLGSAGLADVDVVLQDERMTTITAHNQLLQVGLGMKEHRPRVDQQSAVVLLQAVIDSHRT